MTHVICRNSNEKWGLSYAVKVAAEVYEHHGEQFLQKHCDFMFAQAVADLIRLGNIDEVISLNKKVVQSKFETLSNYGAVFGYLMGPVEEASKSTRGKNKEENKKKDGVKKGKKKACTDNKQIMKLAYMLRGTVSSFVADEKISWVEVVAALRSLAAYYEKEEAEVI